MSRRQRTVFVLIVVEILLAAGWFWLHRSALQQSNPDAPRVVGQVFGTAMGIVAGLSPLLYLMARRNDLKGR